MEFAFPECEKAHDMTRTALFILVLLSVNALHAATDHAATGHVVTDHAVTNHAATEEASDSLFFRHAGDSLVVLANQIPGPSRDKERMDNHARFYDYFQEVLSHPQAFTHPFDSLQTVSLIYSPDSTFRIITWYVPLSGQQFHYAGFIQVPGAAGKAAKLISLQDSTDVIDRKNAGRLDAGKWYGAYYYDLIHQEGMDHYILLGWKGDNPQTRKRVIEPFYIDDNQPFFGKQVFGEPFGKEFRVVFEYSARVSMSLLYEKEPIRNRFGDFPMIVFDRLMPLRHSLQGHYQFYKPEANIFDGLFFDGNQWRFVGDVDVRIPD